MLKKTFEIPLALENLPIPAKDKTQLIPKKEHIIDEIKFAWRVWECINFGLIALIIKSILKKDIRKEVIFCFLDLLILHGMWIKSSDKFLDVESYGANANKCSPSFFKFSISNFL